MQFYAHGTNGRYPVIFDHNAHLHFEKYIDFNKRVVLIVDDNIPEKFYSRFQSYATYKLHASEAMKNMQTVEQIIAFLINSKINRDDLIISIGGGITSDIVGFVSSIYKRGIHWINIPTTVLAMCDAAVGGKTAVNFGGYKNMMGAIYFPDKVIIDMTVLKSLNQRQINNGLCESLKMGLALDHEIVTLLNDYKKNMSKIIKKCILVKDRIVKKDYYDNNSRHVLNFGHTVGHAIEMVLAKNDVDILHGEAVILGMRYMVSDEVLPIVDNFIDKFQIKNNYKFSNSEILEQVRNDKKNLNEKICIAYLSSINKCEILQIDDNDLKLMLERRS